MGSFNGELKARIIDVRFALAGKVVTANKKVGDTVKKSELVASLDRKILQAELDKELSDYEKVRADFEIFAAKNTDTQPEINNYLKKEKQAELNASVKSVELAKAKLDMCDLFSPVNGVLVNDGGIVPGIYITPSSAPMAVVDTDSFYFEIEVNQNDLQNFSESKNVSIEIEGLGSMVGDAERVFSDGKKFMVKVNIPGNDKYLVGMQGKASIN